LDEEMTFLSMLNVIAFNSFLYHILKYQFLDVEPVAVGECSSLSRDFDSGNCSIRPAL